MSTHGGCLRVFGQNFVRFAASQARAASSSGGSKIATGFGIAAAMCSGLGAGLYYSSIAKVSSNTDVKTGTTSASIALPKLDSCKGPLFSPDKIALVFVLGGPGVGKGTQCAKLVAEYDFVHLSAGDLLREERQRPASPYSELIEHFITEGKIVPYEITISLLRDAMLRHPGKERFLIDGFPRNIEQGLEFEAVVCPSKMVLFFECEEEVMLKRLMGRSQNSGRSDDNIESIRKRFRTFHDSTIPVREFYNDWGKLRVVNCAGSIEEVFQKTKSALSELAQI